MKKRPTTAPIVSLSTKAAMLSMREPAEPTLVRMLEMKFLNARAATRRPPSLCALVAAINGTAAGNARCVFRSCKKL